MILPASLPPIRISLQTKLVLSLLTVVLISGLGSLFVGQMVINHSIVHQAYGEAAQKLGVFSEAYDSRLYVKQRLIASLASYRDFQRTVGHRQRTQIFSALQGLGEPTLDVLNVTDAEGKVLVRARNLNDWGDSVADDIYVRAVLRDKRAVSGFDVMEAGALDKEDPALAARAAITLHSSHGVDNPPERETRGLVLKVAAPIWSNNTFVGVIYGVFLVNNDTSILDRAMTLLGDEQLGGKEVNSATVFLGGTRVSTSVRDERGDRAVGTRVSPEVFRKVFQEGQVWRDRANVIGRWVIAAYQPIKDIENHTIGILYTGLLEEKFERIVEGTNKSFLVMFVFTGLFSLFLAAYLVHHFIAPITALVKAAEDITNGDYRRVSIRTTDEMGYLGKVFNNMVDVLAEKDRKFMEDVEQRIARTEKLAVLGRLSSGIAHEINNPLTGVLAFTDVLLESLEGTEYEEDLKVIKAETLRCREIVRGMLNFARETQLEKTPANINRLIDEVLPIVRSHISFQNVKVELKLAHDLPNILVDVNQIKSVLSNLCVNAADAMPDGGTLIIVTRTATDGKFVHIQVSDTGVGIPEENLLKVFDPFFTTKETGKGTGLGLSVTYGIVKRHNGFINIKSKVGVGTRIDIHLPFNSEEHAHG